MSTKQQIQRDIVELISLQTIDFPEEHILTYDKEPDLPSFRKDSEVPLSFDPTTENNFIPIENNTLPPQITITLEEIPIIRSPKKPAKIEIVKNYESDEENERKPWTLGVKSSICANYNEPTPTFLPNLEENDLWDKYSKNDEKKNVESLAFGDVSNIEKDSQIGGTGTYSDIPTLLEIKNSRDTEDFNSSFQAEENIKPETKEQDCSLMLGNISDVSILPAHNETIIMQTESNPVTSPIIPQAPNKPQKIIKIRQRSLKVVPTPIKSSFSPANRKNAHSISIKPLKKSKISSQKSNLFLNSQEFNFSNTTSSKHLNPVKAPNKRESFTKLHLSPSNPYMQEIKKFNKKFSLVKKTVEDGLGLAKKNNKKKRIVFF